ncbi:MAG TPA: DNA-processing protein DprA [Thermomicrobiales bacterium]|nr:DNA-processing protein DprA [Thermomicrobiales bacterium]
MPSDSLRFWIGFHLTPGVGAARISRLVEHFGSIEAAWRVSGPELRQAGVSEDVASSIVKTRSTIDLDDELDRLERNGVSVLTLDDDDYPRLLRHIQSPPPLLYVRGSLTTGDELAIGVVGTRRATTYGLDMAARLSRDLAAAGVTIVSGLALGIDTAAHRAALDAGGRTIAVFGCGLDTIYPPRNRALAARVAESGALVSEFPLGARPDARNFPVRNRIISGLSRGVLVVEAPERSGALITTTFAADQGRDVYAVPGSALSSASAGSHALIRDGALLVTSADDILDQLDIASATVHSQTRMQLPDTPAERILYALVGAEPRHVDDLCHESGLTIQDTSGTLLAMELKGIVRQTGSQHYVRA